MQSARRARRRNGCTPPDHRVAHGAVIHLARSLLMSRWIVTVSLLIILAGCSSTPRAFQPADPITPDRVSDQAWGQIVQAHVRGGQVDYSAIQADNRLDGYLGKLNRIDPAKLPTKHHQLAFWINAYNAFAVKGILDHYSPMTLWGRYRYFIGRDYQV